MKKQELQNAIRINHRGFLTASAKRFVLTENKTESDTFKVVFIDNVTCLDAFEGKMTRVVEGEDTLWIGDFSSVTQPGDYYVEAGGLRSRQFVIYDGAYDICKRVLLDYFRYQRCSHPLGWAGACHGDDGFVKETGEHVDLKGGYHQSCDLRKSPGGVSIGVLSMLRFAMRENSDWAELLLGDEVRWACDYFAKTIQENGAMYNTLNEPFGWEGRTFYKSPAPSSAQWNTTALLALGSLYFSKRSDTVAEKYLEASLRSWNYMNGTDRDKNQYKHPDKFPMGMDPDFFYDLCKPDSSADIAYQITVGADLYRATGKKCFAEKISSLVPTLVSYLSGFALMRDDDRERSVSSSCSYSWLLSGILALCDAYDVVGNEYGISDKIQVMLDEICAYMDKSAWKYAERPLMEADLSASCGHTGETLAQAMKNLKKYNNFYYNDDEIFEPSYALYIGIFLARGCKILGDKKYMSYAQAIADNLLGANELDSSHINAIGYNHAQHSAYGQFFPSTPFIPGAVGVGYSSLDTYTSSSEYDMPCVGLSMYLLSLLE